MCSTGSRHSAIRSAGSLGKLAFPLDLGRLIPTCCYFIVSRVPVARLAFWCRRFRSCRLCGGGKKKLHLLVRREKVRAWSTWRKHGKLVVQSVHMERSVPLSVLLIYFVEFC